MVLLILFFRCDSIVPLLAFPLYAIQHVVELFYYGEIRVLSNIKTQVKKALDFLEVDYDIPSERREARVPFNMPPFTPAQMANQKTASQMNGRLLIFIYRILFLLLFAFDWMFFFENQSACFCCSIFNSRRSCRRIKAEHGQTESQHWQTNSEHWKTEPGAKTDAKRYHKATGRSTRSKCHSDVSIIVNY